MGDLHKAIFLFLPMTVYLEDGLENTGGTFYGQLGHRICHSTFLAQPCLPCSGRSGCQNGMGGGGGDWVWWVGGQLRRALPAGSAGAPPASTGSVCKKEEGTRLRSESIPLFLPQNPLLRWGIWHHLPLISLSHWRLTVPLGSPTTAFLLRRPPHPQQLIPDGQNHTRPPCKFTLTEPTWALPTTQQSPCVFQLLVF